MCNACPPAQPATEDATAEAFAERMLDTLNQGALGLMLSVGHRTGLLDAMVGAGAEDWLTSDDLAARSGRNERYVREWLGAMATGRVVEVDGSGAVDCYRLPAAHAAVLSRAGESMGTIFQWLAVMGEVETQVVDAFAQGGGVPYEAYSRFHEVMAEDSALTVVAGLHEHIVPLVDGLAERLAEGIDALDIGCGSGRALCELAARYPDSRFTGFDLCEPAIEAARTHARTLGLDNVRFEQRDVTTLVQPDQFDLVTAFDVIHDQRDPAGVLKAVRHVLRSDGAFLMQDLQCDSRVSNNVGHPLCPMLYTISTMHCMTVSLAQGGAGLGAAWGEQLAVQMLGDAGFERVTVNRLPHDIQNNWYVMQD